jgi:ATP-binding cassette subfamily C protein CydC
MRADLLRILGLWRGRLPWLILGAVLAMLGLAAAVGLMALSGAMIGAAVATGTLVAPVLLRGLGGARIVLRYAERLWRARRCYSRCWSSSLPRPRRSWP